MLPLNHKEHDAVRQVAEHAQLSFLAKFQRKVLGDQLFQLQLATSATPNHPELRRPGRPFLKRAPQIPNLRHRAN